MSPFFPLYYVYAGNCLLLILFIISLQQICWTPIGSIESPNIRSKILTCSFCFATYALNCLLLYHYYYPHANKIVSIMRLFTCFTFCLGTITTFKFVTTSMDALYKSKTNHSSSPPWFIHIWQISTSCVVSIVVLGTCCAYWFNNGIFFDLYNIAIDIPALIACVGIIIAMLEIRHRVSQIMVNKKQTTAKRFDKLRRKKWKLDLIITAVMIGIITIALDVYNAVTMIMALPVLHIPLYASPYPTLKEYLMHVVFTLSVDTVLILWIWKRCPCCKHRQTENTVELSKTLLTTPSISDDEHTISSTKSEDKLRIVHVCCPCLDPNDADELIRKVTAIRNRTTPTKTQPSQKNVLSSSCTLTPMPKRSTEAMEASQDTIAVMLYNFENVLLLAPNMIFSLNVHGTFEALVPLFGGVSRIKLLRKHFRFLSNQGIKVCLMSDQVVCRDLERILLTLNLCQRFDEVIGIDHGLFKSETEYSLNEKLLKITNKFDDVSPFNIVYIDSNLYTCNIERSNICHVFGINALRAMNHQDMINIQDKWT
eukprot:101847_1